MTSPRRLRLIAGNWKMHRTLPESRALAEEVLSGSASLLGDARGDLLIGLYPSAVSLSEVASAVEAASAGREFLIGAQNMHFESEGAFTGEISAEMIRSAGGSSVILGHSERRHVFGEDDELVSKKVAKAVASGLRPILCVGETIEERDAGRTTEVVETQLSRGIERLERAEQVARVIIAYEPVWAIGTGRTATPDQAQEVHAFIRSELAKAFGRLGKEERSAECLILYGGSVKPDNAGDLLSRPDINGALVGGASLNAESFLRICSAGAATR